MKLALLPLLAAGCLESSAPLRATSTIRELKSTREVSVSRTQVAAACEPLSWPVMGPLSSPFGPRDGRPHDGIDLAVEEGTPVHAACDGVVAYAGEKLRGYGRLIIVAHAGGLATVYAHNSRLEVKEGDRVARGQELARSGATGHVTAPHVHFEVRRDDRPEDPLKHLAPRVVVQARNGNYGPSRRETDRPNP